VTPVDYPAQIIEQAHRELDDNPLAPRRHAVPQLYRRIDQARDTACTIIDDCRAEIDRLKAINVGVGKDIERLRSERDNYKAMYESLFAGRVS